MLRVPYTYDHLSAMSGVTLQGQLFTLVRPTALTGVESVQFLRHIQHQVGVNLLAIWDGSPIHRSTMVKSFLADRRASTIHLEQLPPYAPDLNPDEGVWHLLKDVQLRNVCCLNLGHLQYELGLAIRRLRRQPQVLQACFREAGLELDRV